MTNHMLESGASSSGVTNTLDPLLCALSHCDRKFNKDAKELLIACDLLCKIRHILFAPLYSSPVPSSVPCKS